jgi:alkanesulfonate monooxygenase SsuD/methylene tetrahydromethanopterin reductase-like flavin-dependent oxidoreductase (luciferase family)
MTAQRFECLEEALQICLQMWSDDDGAFDGKHYQLAETLCSPKPVSSPRPRLLIDGGGERKTLRLVARYADACNVNGDVATVAHKVEVLRRHCDDVGRDPGQIEVTAGFTVADDADLDTILAQAEALEAVGVQTIVASSATAEPVKSLEDLWAPVIQRLGTIGTG